MQAAIKTQEAQTIQRSFGSWIFEASTKTIRSVPANHWIATMDSFDGAVDHEANAHLIAAAPNLLRSADVAQSNLLSIIETVQGLPESVRDELKRTANGLNAAIAKAMGAA